MIFNIVCLALAKQTLIATFKIMSITIKEISPKSEVAQLNEVAGEASALLSRLANPDRLLILCLLVNGEKNVSEIGQESGIVQPTLSQQLTVLRKDGLVHTRRNGKYVYYRLENEQVLALMQTLYQIFCAP